MQQRKRAVGFIVINAKVFASSASFLHILLRKSFTSRIYNGSNSRKESSLCCLEMPALVSFKQLEAVCYILHIYIYILF